MMITQTLPALLQEIVLSLVLSDLHQIVLPPPPRFVAVDAEFVRLLPDLRARIGSQRHWRLLCCCWEEGGVGSVALEKFDEEMSRREKTEVGIEE